MIGFFHDQNQDFIYYTHHTGVSIYKLITKFIV